MGLFHSSTQRAMSNLEPEHRSLIAANYKRILPILFRLLSKRDIYNRNRTWPGASPEGKGATRLLNSKGRKRLRKIIKAYAYEHGEDVKELTQLCEAYCCSGLIGLADALPSKLSPLVPAHLQELADFIRLGKHPRANAGIFIRSLLDNYADALGLPKLPEFVSRYAFTSERKTERWFVGENAHTAHLPKTTHRLNRNLNYPHRTWHLLTTQLDVACCLSHRHQQVIYPQLMWIVDENTESLMGFRLCPTYPIHQDILLCYRWSIWHPGSAWWKARGVPEYLRVPPGYEDLVRVPDAMRAMHYMHCRLLKAANEQVYTAQFSVFPEAFRDWLGTIRDTPTLYELRLRLLDYLRDEAAETFAVATPTVLREQQVSLPWSDGIAAALLLPSAGMDRVQQRRVSAFGVAFEVADDGLGDGIPVDVRYDPDDARTVFLIHSGVYISRACAAAFEHHLSWLDLVSDPAQLGTMEELHA